MAGAAIKSEIAPNQLGGVEIPADWRIVELGEIAAVSSGGSAPQGDHYFGGPNRFVRVQHLQESTAAVVGWDGITSAAVKRYGLKLYPKGTILLPKSGASIRLEKRARLPFDAYVVSHLCAILPDTRQVDPDYLFHLLRRVLFAESKAEGYPTLRLSEIRERAIPLPPLAEQRRIARVLNSIQRTSEAQDGVLAATRELKRSLMSHLFTYGPLPPRQAAAVTLAETELGQINGSWPLLRCEKVCEVITVGVVVRPASHYVEAGIPAFRSFNIREDRLNTKDLVYFSKEDSDGPLSKSALRSGDVLIVRTGYPGTSCIVPPEFDGANCIDLVIARPKRRVILSEYLSRFFNSTAGRAQALSAKTGLAQQHLNVGAVKRTLIPVPPLDIQAQVVRQMAAVDAKICGEECSRAALETLFQSMLHHLMTGKTRVNELEP